MSFTTSVIEWYRENGRSLPWRETNDPYAIWLSEVILQQTRIEQGRPYWERFMQRWPTVDSLAAATEDEVLREWQGLGYYSRARNLHTAAKQIAAIGHFPNTMEELRRLKGIGDYTAAAIGSIAFGLPVAVVDGNVYRVLSRCFGISTPINTTEGKKEFAVLAQHLLELPMESVGKPPFSGRFGEANQALMDFGALQCTPASPRCGTCPLVDSCCAFREGRVGELPVKLKKLKVKEIKMTYIYIRYKGETALRRRPAGDIWQGLYEPLLIENGQWTVDNCELCIANCQLLRKKQKHVLTHRIIYTDFYLWEPDERPKLPEGYFWVPESDLDQYGVPRLVEKLFELLTTHYSPLTKIINMRKINIAIFVSGSGTNCENLIRYFTDSPRVNCALVVSNKADAFALERAKRLNVPTAVTPKAQLNDMLFMRKLLQDYRIDFIVLAGFLPMVPDFLINDYPQRIINLHPALLPKFGGKGMWGHHVHEAVKAAGETETGMTVHYVTPVCDGGEPIAQFRTAITPDDSVDDIAAKEHELEMKYFPQVVDDVIRSTFF